MLRQQRVFHRAKQCGLQTQKKQADHQQAQALQPETQTDQEHDGDLEPFYQARQQRLVVLVGQLPGGGRKQKEGQDENACSQIHQQARRQAAPLRRLKRNQHDQGVFE